MAGLIEQEKKQGLLQRAIGEKLQGVATRFLKWRVAQGHKQHLFCHKRFKGFRMYLGAGVVLENERKFEGINDGMVEGLQPPRMILLKGKANDQGQAGKV